MTTTHQHEAAAAPGPTSSGWIPFDVAPKIGLLEAGQRPKVLAARRHTRTVDYIWPSQLDDHASDGSPFYKAWKEAPHPDDDEAVQEVTALQWGQIRNILGFQDDDEAGVGEVLERIAQLQAVETEVLKAVREQSGYDGFDDKDGVDVVQELREHLDEMSSMLEREQEWRRGWTELQRTTAAIAVHTAREGQARDGSEPVQITRSELDDKLGDAREQGGEAARHGVQEVSAGFDDLPFNGCPETWGEKLFARIAWYADRGDASVGIQSQSGWTLAEDQSGTVIADLAAAAAAAEVDADKMTPLETAQYAYAMLANIHCEWPGRSTLAGQSVLANLRDFIASATGMSPQEVQDAGSVRRDRTSH